MGYSVLYCLDHHSMQPSASPSPILTQRPYLSKSNTSAEVPIVYADGQYVSLGLGNLRVTEIIWINRAILNSIAVSNFALDYFGNYVVPLLSMRAIFGAYATTKINLAAYSNSTNSINKSLWPMDLGCVWILTSVFCVSILA